MKTGYVYSPIYLRHDTGDHVENAHRLEAIMAHLERTGVKQRLTLITPRPATIKELALVHDEEYISEIRETAEKGGGWLDADTVMSRGSYEAAVYAAGGAIRATEVVMSGEVSSAFALVRPPGHHATPRRAMGFCLFNNIAIAAKYAMERFGLERVAIIDFDVHHGNGTQEAFYENPQVLYISTHQFPFYPGSGSIEEVGRGKGKGTNINIPLPAGCGDAEFEQVYRQVVVDAVERFNPRLILVSAGYDPHWADTLAMMQVSVTGFAQMVKIIKGLAGERCGGNLVFSLEGGYNVNALAASVNATFRVLLGDIDIDDPVGQPPRKSPAPDISSLITRVKQTHGLP